MPEADLTKLVEKLGGLAALLADFAALREAILAERDFIALPAPGGTGPFQTDQESEPAKIGALTPLLLSMPGVSVGLLVRDQSQERGANSTVFRFLFDRYGVEYRHETADRQLDLVREAIALLDGFQAAMDKRGLSLETLFKAGVLPSTLNPAVLTAAADRLRTVGAPAELKALEAEVTLLRGLPETMRGPAGRGPHSVGWAIAVLVALVGRLQEDVHPNLRPDGERALDAIDRMLGVRGLAEDMAAPPMSTQRARSASPTSDLVQTLLGLAPIPMFGGAQWWTAAIEAARSDLDLCFLRAEVRIAEDGEFARLWRTRVEGWLIARRSAAPRDRSLDPPILYADVIAAAAGARLPGRLRADLDSMSVAEWSQHCMEVFNDPPELAWRFPCGLMALGFGEAVVAAARARGDAPPSRTAEGDRQPFILMMVSSPIAYEGPPALDQSPVFTVPTARTAEYDAVVRWLVEHATPKLAKG